MTPSKDMFSKLRLGHLGEVLKGDNDLANHWQGTVSAMYIVSDVHLSEQLDRVKDRHVKRMFKYPIQGQAECLKDYNMLFRPVLISGITYSPK